MGTLVGRLLMTGAAGIVAAIGIYFFLMLFSDVNTTQEQTKIEYQIDEDKFNQEFDARWQGKAVPNDPDREARVAENKKRLEELRKRQDANTAMAEADKAAIAEELRKLDKR